MRNTISVMRAASAGVTSAKKRPQVQEQDLELAEKQLSEPVRFFGLAFGGLGGGSITNDDSEIRLLAGLFRRR